MSFSTELLRLWTILVRPNNLGDYGIGLEDQDGQPIPPPSGTVVRGNVGANVAIDVLALENPTQQSDTLLAAFEQTGLQVGLTRDPDTGAVVGDPTYRIHPRYEDYRPLGNDANGKATKWLTAANFLGRQRQRLGDNGDRYPNTSPDASPFTVKAERFYRDQPIPWVGWTVRWPIKIQIGARDPGARAMAWYDENWNYIGTTGAFQQDGEGNWFSEMPIGRETGETKVPYYYALLWGSKQEGLMILEADQDERVDEFWTQSRSQGTGRPRVDEIEDRFAPMSKPEHLKTIRDALHAAMAAQFEQREGYAWSYFQRTGRKFWVRGGS